MTGPQLRKLAALFDAAGHSQAARECRNRAAARESGVHNLTERAASGESLLANVMPTRQSRPRRLA